MDLRQTLRQEVADANPASKIYHDVGSLCEAVLQTHLGTCDDFVHGRNPILCPADRIVTAVLRVMGLSGEKHFQNYHRVLNPAVWSSLEARGDWRSSEGRDKTHLLISEFCHVFNPRC